MWYTDNNHLRVSARTRSKSVDATTADSTEALALLVTSTNTAEAESRPPPKSRAAAMKEDAAGWTLAEQGEMANHASNQSFTVLTRSEFERAAPGRRLIRMLWVYARKRSGRLKARLCVQGCAQMLVTDFDQTFSATFRHSSLIRILSAIAAQKNFLMRRWDFVSAYLQGEVEEGETVYCSVPPGPYSQQGEDGHPKVWRVDKPIYMASHKLDVDGKGRSSNGSSCGDCDSASRTLVCLSSTGAFARPEVHEKTPSSSGAMLTTCTFCTTRATKNPCTPNSHKRSKNAGRSKMRKRWRIY